MSASPDLTAAGIKLILYLVLMLGGLLLGYAWLRRGVKRRSGGTGRRIRVLESHYLGVKKSLALVEVPGSVLVLGLTNEAIRVLAQLDPAMLQSSNADDEPVPPAPSFTAQLNKLVGRFRWDNRHAG